MAAYAAVVSLNHTINGLLNSSPYSSTLSTAEKLAMAAYAAVISRLCCSSSRIPSSREILKFAYNETKSLQQVLERLDERSRSRSSMERVDALEGQIRDCANKLEDFLEFHELEMKEEEYGDEGVMREEISSFGETAKRMEKEYIQELSRDNEDDDEDEATTGSSDIDFGVEMIGRSVLFDTILRFHVVKRMRPDDRYVCAFLGERGSGSRVVVKTVFEDEAQNFECRGWVSVGAHYKLKQVLMNIISQVVVDDNELMLDNISEVELSIYLYKALENRRYMIVLDDVDDVELVDLLRRYTFPDQSNGSVILLTTNSQEMDASADAMYNYVVPDTYEELLWLSMQQALFGRESIPTELEVAGKKIIHTCGCRVILAAKILLFLSKADKKWEQWSKIAADKENPIYMVGDEVSEVSEIKKEMQYCKREIVEQASAWIDFASNIKNVKMWMYPERFFSRMQVISFFGMAGIGKTTFARNLFKDDSTLSRFDHRVWIAIGPKYHMERILIDILAQIYPDIHTLDMNVDEILIKELCAQVSKKSCLIVLDNLCSKQPLLHLKCVFPDIMGTILVTTRLPKVAKFGKDDTEIEMQLLDKEESWCLLRENVFDLGLCPPELEKVGRKIAEKCDGLPLLILTVADLLCKVEQSEEYWNNVASGKEKSVFKSAHHQISTTLLPSYHNLPQHLKPCFLYIGVFLEKYEIPTSILTNLWMSEGFVKPNLLETEEDFIAECLSDLVDRSLVMVRHKVSVSPIMTCRLHSVFWHLSNSQATKNKLFHAMNCYDDCSIERMERQQRLCIRNNILLGIKDVQKSMAFNTSVHSLLCVGPLHQFPVHLNFDLRLLRVMNALMVCLYQFPIEVTSLYHLKYLSLTSSGKLPASISKLQKLQQLIVKQYMNIKSSRNSGILPEEIWDMKELKHLQIMGGCLPNHRHGSGLLKLSTLLDVSAQSCGDGVLKWIPNLKRLGIRIELAPTDKGYPFHCLNNIHHLRRLESLKCVVVNPQNRSEVLAPLAPILMFPQNLKKLSLSGFGYPWEHMSIFGKLENLEVLKLKCYAFQGPKWEMGCTNEFEKLKYLLLEDTNLVNWKLSLGADMKVEYVCIKHCYKLQELPPSLYTIHHLKKIEIVDCSPLLVTWTEKMKRILSGVEVTVHRSWLAQTDQE